MSGKTTVWSEDVLGLLLNATPISNIAINATSGPLTSLYVSLHTSDPGVGGNQTTHEAAYTGYARVSVARNAGSPAWTITGEVASPNSNINFPTATGGSETETYIGIGSASSGTGVLYYSGPISPTIAVSNTITPSILSSSTLTEQ